MKLHEAPFLVIEMNRRISKREWTEGKNKNTFILTYFGAPSLVEETLVFQTCCCLFTSVG